MSRASAKGGKATGRDYETEELTLQQQRWSTRTLSESLLQRSSESESEGKSFGYTHSPDIPGIENSETVRALYSHIETVDGNNFTQHRTTSETSTLPVRKTDLKDGSPRDKAYRIKEQAAETAGDDPGLQGLEEEQSLERQLVLFKQKEATDLYLAEQFENLEELALDILSDEETTLEERIDWSQMWCESLLMLGRWKEAIDLFNTYQLSNDKHPRAALMLVEAKLQIGEVEEARKICLQALKPLHVQRKNSVKSQETYYVYIDQMVRISDALNKSVEAKFYRLKAKPGGLRYRVAVAADQRRAKTRKKRTVEGSPETTNHDPESGRRGGSTDENNEKLGRLNKYSRLDDDMFLNEFLEAVSVRDNDLIQLLLLDEAIVTRKKKDSKTAIYCTVLHGLRGPAEALKSKGAVLDCSFEYAGRLRPFLHIMVECLKTESVQLLADLGADINIREGLTGNTALHTLTACCDFPDTDKADMADLLCRCGADVNAANRVGFRPLGYMKEWQDPHLRRVLVKYGAK